MRKWVSFSVFCGIFFASAAFALDTKDRDSIHQIVDHFATAWNQQEGRGFADYYAEDADFVNIFGMTFSGKQEIEDRHVKILETIFKGSVFDVADVKIREVKPGLAIVQTHWTVSGIQKTGAETKEVLKGVFTHAFVKNGDEWQITSSQNTAIN